jgi:hypothetical protein
LDGATRLPLDKARQLAKFLAIEQGVLIVVEPREERFEVSHAWTAARTTSPSAALVPSPRTASTSFAARPRAFPFETFGPETAPPARRTLGLGRNRLRHDRDGQHDRPENDVSHVYS